MIVALAAALSLPAVADTPQRPRDAASADPLPSFLDGLVDIEAGEVHIVGGLIIAGKERVSIAYDVVLVSEDRVVVGGPMGVVVEGDTVRIAGWTVWSGTDGETEEGQNPER